jgi:NADH-quinone oxidoreductase subunit H
LQLLAYLAYATLSGVFMFHVVVCFKSKYATLAAARLLLVGAALEVFFSLCLLFFACHAGSLSLGELVGSGVSTPLVCALPPLALVLLLYSLFEAKRAPFDHSEAESELVAGHLVELGGRALLFFYLAEYVHVFFCVVFVYFCFFAGFTPGCWVGVWPGVVDVLCLSVVG